MEECRCKTEKVGIFCDQSGCKRFVCLECLCQEHYGHKTLTFTGICRQMVSELEPLADEKPLQVSQIIKEQLDECFAKLNTILREMVARFQASLQTLLNAYINSTRLNAIQQFINKKGNMKSPKEWTPEVCSLLEKLKECGNLKEYNMLPRYHSQYVDLIQQIRYNKIKENSIHRFKDVIEDDFHIISDALKNFQTQMNNLLSRMAKEVPKSTIVFHQNAPKELSEYNSTFPPTLPKPYVYYWKADSLYVYLINQKRIIYGLDYLTDYSFGCCMWKNKIYFSGGGKSEEYYAKTVECEIQENTASSKALAEMLKPKCSHTLVAFNGSHVYSLGGFIDRRDNNFSEVYSVEKNVWQQIRSLIESKAYVIACTFRNRYIYCIGGRGCTPEHSIEIYDALCPEDGWLSKEILERVDILTKNNYGEAIQNSTNSLIILSRSTLFDYNVVTNKFTKRCDVNAEDLGLEIVPLLHKTWIYQIAKRSPKPYIEAFSTLVKKTCVIDIDQQ